MWLTDQNGKYFSQIMPKFSTLVKQWWSGNIEGSALDSLMEEIKTIHSKRLWIACDCGAQDSPPLLAPVLRGNTYYLVRLTKRGMHSETCTFFFQQKEFSTESDSAPISAGIGDMPDFSAQEAGGFLSKNPQHNIKDSNNTRSTAIPAIAKRLWWLFEKAGIQHSSTVNSISSLLNLVTDLPFGKNGKTLRDGIFFHRSAHANGWIRASLNRQKKSGVIPICWWVFEINGVDTESRRVHFNHHSCNSIPVEGKLKIWGGDSSPVRFPMIAIAQITLIDDGLSIQELYAHPCVGGVEWMRGDSNHERNAVADLFNVQTWLKNSKNVIIDFHKPLFQWKETGERPDFVVTKHKAHAVHCIIETMGYDDEAYLRRKTQLKSNLSNIVQIIEDNRLSNPEASRILKSNVARWALSNS